MYTKRKLFTAAIWWACCQFMTRLTMVEGGCNTGQWTMQFILLSANTVIGTKLSDVTSRSRMACQSACERVDTCFSVAYTQTTGLCSLFGAGGTAYDVSGRLVFNMTRKTVTYESASCYPCAGNPCLNQGTCMNIFTPEPQYTCACLPLFSGTLCQYSQSAFYVGSVPASISPSTNIVFNTSVISVNSPYNATTAQLSTVPMSGIYWFQLSAGIPANTATNLRLNGLPYSLTIFTNTTNYAADVIVADTIQSVNYTTQLSVSSQQDLLFGSSSGGFMGTSLLGFRLDSIMSPAAFFSVQLTADIPPSSTGTTPCNFDRVLVNVGGGWNPAKFAFSAPYAGNYFISFATSAGAIAGSQLFMAINGVERGTICLCEGCTGAHNGVQIVRGALLMPLTAGDNVTFYAGAGLTIKGSPEGLTNAQGFLYSPQMITPVAWCVTRTSPGWDYYATSGPMVYDSPALINLNNVWYPSSNQAVIPADAGGVYFIDLTTYFCGQAGCGINCNNGNPLMQLLVNNNPVITIQMTPIGFSNCITRSRSIILRLNAYDILYVATPTGCFYADGNREQFFSGMRLF